MIKEESGGTLTLTRSQGSGPMAVSLTIDNGGTSVSNNVNINVREPASDAWVQRTPDATENPVTKQFFARDPGTGLGTIHYCGTQADATEVYLKVFTTDTGTDVPYATHRQTLAAGAYSFAAPIAAGKVTYMINPITQQLAGGVFKYTRTKDSGLTYKIYYSTNLADWTMDAAAIQSPAAALAGVETVTVTLASVAPLDGKLFVRVEASPMP